MSRHRLSRRRPLRRRYRFRVLLIVVPNYSSESFPVAVNVVAIAALSVHLKSNYEQVVLSNHRLSRRCPRFCRCRFRVVITRRRPYSWELRSLLWHPGMFGFFLLRGIALGILG